MRDISLFLLGDIPEGSHPGQGLSPLDCANIAACAFDRRYAADQIEHDEPRSQREWKTFRSYEYRCGGIDPLGL